jgi:hypothetical protein
VKIDGKNPIPEQIYSRTRCAKKKLSSRRQAKGSLFQSSCVHAASLQLPVSPRGTPTRHIATTLMAEEFAYIHFYRFQFANRTKNETVGVAERSAGPVSKDSATGYSERSRRLVFKTYSDTSIP